MYFSVCCRVRLLAYGTMATVSTTSCLCGLCKLPVKNGNKALQCEGPCSFWFHCDCIFGCKINSTQYKKVAASDEAWYCANCTGDHQLPPFNTVNAIDVFHFDYQKNLPTPQLTAGKQFYLRLLWTYNFGVYCASRDVSCAFMWNELVAHRGANSVVSCLMKLIFSTRAGRTGVKWGIWWADNCPGQNKNHCVIWFFQDLIRRGVYSRVDYKFLVVGHTYGPADRYFGVIEKHVRKIENVYTPEEWYKHVKESSLVSSSKIEVIEMEQSGFYDHWSYLRNMYAERKTDIDECEVEFSKVLWFNFGVGEELTAAGILQEKKHPQEVWIRYTHDPFERPKKMSFKKKSNVHYIPLFPAQLYDGNPLPIKPAKASDLKKLAKDYLPESVMCFYMNIQTLDQ